MQKKCNYWLLCPVGPRSAVTDPAVPLSPPVPPRRCSLGCPSWLAAPASAPACWVSEPSLLSAPEQLLSDTWGDSASGTEASLGTPGSVSHPGCWCWLRCGPVHVWWSDGPCRLNSNCTETDGLRQTLGEGALQGRARPVLCHKDTSSSLPQVCHGHRHLKSQHSFPQPLCVVAATNDGPNTPFSPLHSWDTCPHYPTRL